MFLCWSLQCISALNICAVSLLGLTEPLADIYVSMQGVGVH